MTHNQPRIVLDTNVLVSRLLAACSTPGKVARHAANSGVLLVSKDTLDERVSSCCSWERRHPAGNGAAKMAALPGTALTHNLFVVAACHTLQNTP